VWRALTDGALVEQWLGAGATVVDRDEPRRVVYRVAGDEAVVTLDAEDDATRVCVQMDADAAAEVLPKIERMISDPAGHAWVVTKERSEYGDPGWQTR
ncbi:MAG TPA: hypothetical protein VGR02_22840, partial [Thermoanaerobaculia bacterium]|nr:hypothetical protein [Thermoanaerobaculia bacterium]